MKKELDDHLCSAFPNLYADRHSDMRSTCMCWGFDVGDGWYQLLLGISQKLEPYAVQYPEFRAVQVKEKFGGLRFYTTCVIDEAQLLIDEAEELSFTICEDCGQPGKPRGGGWIRTLCDEHAGPRKR